MQPIIHNHIHPHHIIGPALCMVGSALTVYVSRVSPLVSFAWFTIGASTGWVAKKILYQYNEIRCLTRSMLQTEIRVNLQRQMVIAIISISSVLFPHIFNIFSFAYGVFVGTLL